MAVKKLGLLQSQWKLVLQESCGPIHHDRCTTVNTSVSLLYLL